jgi:hypothetical protein
VRRAGAVLLLVVLWLQSAAIVAFAATIRCYGRGYYCDSSAAYISLMGTAMGALALGAVVVARYATRRAGVTDDQSGASLESTAVPDNVRADGADPVSPADRGPVLESVSPSGAIPQSASSTDRGSIEVAGPQVDRGDGSLAVRLGGVIGAAEQREEERRTRELVTTLADNAVAMAKELLGGHAREIGTVYAFAKGASGALAQGEPPETAAGHGVLDLARTQLEESVRAGVAATLGDQDLVGLRAARLIGGAPRVTAPPAASPARPLGLGRIGDWGPRDLMSSEPGAGPSGGMRRQWLEVIGASERWTAVAHAGRDGAFECVVYRRDERDIAIVNTRRGPDSIDPAPVQAIVRGIADVLGTQQQPPLGFRARLGRDNAIALLAVVDELRAAGLDSREPVLDPRTLARGAGADDRQRLTAHLASRGMDPERMRIALSGLAVEGLLTTDLAPNPRLLELSRRFALLVRAIRIAAGGQRRPAYDAVAVQGVGGEILIVERGDTSVAIATLGPGEVVELLRELFG